MNLSHKGFCPFSNLLLDKISIKVEGLGIDIHKDSSCSLTENTIGRSREAEGGGDHPIGILYTAYLYSWVKARSAAAYRNRIPSPYNN